MHRTSPSRYEYFEAWLTPKEWATWKKYSLYHFRDMHEPIFDGVPQRKRTEYLNEQIDFDNMLESEAEDEFRDMIDHYLRWRDTPQGVEHWQGVAQRTRPIRTL
jgi:hypothetical protein